MQIETGRRVFRNVSVMFTAQMITWVSSFVLLYFLPRYLGSEDFGRLYLAISIKMMLGLLIDFGGGYLIPKEVARAEAKGGEILNSYLLLRIGLWALSIGLILILSKLLGYSEHVHLLILVLAIGKLWEGGTTALNAWFQGVEKMEYPSIGYIVERLFVAVFAVGALLMGGDSLSVAIIMSIGTFLNLIVILWFARGRIPIRPRLNWDVFGLIRSGMPYFLFSLFSVIYYRIDAVMISAITNDVVTGWYGGAYRFFDMVMVLPLLYRTAIFPVFSRLWENKTGELTRTVGESVRLMILMGIPVALFIFTFAEEIIHFFMGLEEYQASVIILQIFAISIPIIFIDIILGSAILGAANKQRSWAVVGLVAIFVNIGANLFLISWAQELYGNGGIGAAIATLITELFVMFCALWLLPGSYLVSFKGAYLWKPIAASLLLFIFFWFAPGLGIHWILATLAAPVIYLAGLMLIRTFDQEEIEIMKRLWTT